MRTFIALELPEEFAYEVAELSRSLSHGVKGRFMKRDTYHLTLAFLGDTTAEGVSAACDVLDSLEGRGVIPLIPNGLGKFGRSADATLWLGLSERSELMSLAEDVRAGLQAQNAWFDPKPFKPHITLARRCKLADADLSQLPFPIASEACRVKLFKSNLSSEGASYDALHSVTL
ncbi:MAG: RNA 2',3'-cyclic phosphodiesterase [Eggerthellaceae bacterium]